MEGQQCQQTGKPGREAKPPRSPEQRRQKPGVALHNSYGSDGAALLWQHIRYCRRTVLWPNKQRSVLRPQVGRIFPGRIRVYYREWLLDERLDIPGSATGIQDDLLPRASAYDTPFDSRNSLSAPLFSQRNSAKFD